MKTLSSFINKESITTLINSVPEIKLSFDVTDELKYLISLFIKIITPCKNDNEFNPRNCFIVYYNLIQDKYKELVLEEVINFSKNNKLSNIEYNNQLFHKIIGIIVNYLIDSLIRLNNISVTSLKTNYLYFKDLDRINQYQYWNETIKSHSFPYLKHLSFNQPKIEEIKFVKDNGICYKLNSNNPQIAGFFLENALKYSLDNDISFEMVNKKIEKSLFNVFEYEVESISHPIIRLIMKMTISQFLELESHKHEKTTEDFINLLEFIKIFKDYRYAEMTMKYIKNMKDNGFVISIREKIKEHLKEDKNYQFHSIKLGNDNNLHGEADFIVDRFIIDAKSCKEDTLIDWNVQLQLYKYLYENSTSGKIFKDKIELYIVSFISGKIYRFLN